MTPSLDGVLLHLVGELQARLELDDLYEGLMAALREAVPSDYVSLNALGPDPAKNWSIVVPSVSDEMFAVWAEYAHENPLVERYMRTRDGRAYRFSDVTTARRLHATNLYRELYKPLGVEHQIAFTLPSERDSVLGVALNRGSRDYTNRERDLLNRARPFLIQAYRNALAHTELRERADSRLPGAINGRMRDRGLSPREADAVSLVALGRSNQAIADELGLSIRTVHKHLQNAYRKLGVRRRSDAAAEVWRKSA